MTGKAKRLLPALLGCIALLTALAGCDSKGPEVTKTEEANFKGGPMPESARQIMQQKIKEASTKNGPQGSSAPAGAGPAGANIPGK